LSFVDARHETRIAIIIFCWRSIQSRQGVEGALTSSPTVAELRRHRGHHHARAFHDSRSESEQLREHREHAIIKMRARGGRATS
jgi:hypothetical protein